MAEGGEVVGQQNLGFTLLTWGAGGARGFERVWCMRYASGKQLGLLWVL